MRQNPLIIRYLLWMLPIFAPLIAASADPEPVAANFDPQKGFKPAQRSFQPIFLQMAGSFEAHGTPANYLRHVNAEAKRVEAAWLKAKGKPAKFRPVYFTEQYIEKLITGWNQMAPILALESFTKNAGRQTRYAILGTENVPATELAASETALSKAELTEFQRLLAKPSFKKSDLSAIDVFYSDGNGFDKLSTAGKAEANKRVWRGLMDGPTLDADIAASKSGTIVLSVLGKHQHQVVAGIEGNGETVTADSLHKALAGALKLNIDDVNFEKLPASSRDSVVYAHEIKGALDRKLVQIAKQASPQQMKDINLAISLILENLLVATQLEFETGLWDETLRH